jgi:hypothetical protein
VVTESVNSNSTNFGILTSCVVFGYEGLNLVAHRVLTRNRGKTRCLCATTRGS